MTKKQVMKVLSTLDSILGNVASRLTDCEESMQEKYDERSDNWQESDTGQEYAELIEQISNLKESTEELQSEVQQVIT